MTIGELITHLETMPQDMNVYLNDDGTEYPLRYIGPTEEHDPNSGIVFGTDALHYARQ